MKIKFVKLMKAPLTNYWSIRQLNLILNNCDFKKDDLILDIGTGNGIMPYIISEKVKKVVGIDISEPIIRFNKENNLSNNIDFVCLNTTKDPPNKFVNKFDKCFSIDVLEHVTNPAKMIDFSYKILKKGGKLIITFPINRVHGEHYFKINDVQKLFKNSNYFKVNINSYKTKRIASFISLFYGWAIKIFISSKEANRFDEYASFKMITNPTHMHILYKFIIILLYKICQDAYYPDTREARRVLVVAEK